MNLYVSGYIDEILQSLPVPVFLAGYFYEREHPSQAVDEGELLEEPIELQTIIKRGTLVLASPSSDEEWMAMCDFAALVGTDSEASTLALALHRQWSIGVDEPYSITQFRRHAQHIPLLSTPVFMKYWAEQLSPPPHKIARAIQNIQRRGYYLLPSSDPFFVWWKEYANL